MTILTLGVIYLVSLTKGLTPILEWLTLLTLLILLTLLSLGLPLLTLGVTFMALGMTLLSVRLTLLTTYYGGNFHDSLYFRAISFNIVCESTDSCGNHF